MLRSEDSAVHKGDHLYGRLRKWPFSVFVNWVQSNTCTAFQQYAVLPNIDGLTVVKNEEKLPWSVYVGIAGMPGQTAWCGWKEYAAPKKGDIVFVSSGAGPVGNMAIQLAKRDGCKVITCASSDEKVEQLKKIVGADVAFNYKTTSVWDVLEKEGPINM